MSRSGLLVTALACGTLLVVLAGCGSDSGATGQSVDTAGKPQPPPPPPANWALAFSYSPNGGVPQSVICTMTSDGLTRKQLTIKVRGQKDMKPAWSPDGETIAFTRLGSGGVYSLCTIKPDATGLVTLGRLPAAVSAIRWFPDGSRLLVSADAICTVDLPSLTLQRLDAPIAEGGINLRDCYDDAQGRHYRWDVGAASIAPVAGTSRLLVAFDAGDRQELLTDRTDVCVVSVAMEGGRLVRADGKLAGPTAVLKLAELQASPALSPDAGSVAYTTAKADGTAVLSVAGITDPGGAVGFGTPTDLSIGPAAMAVYTPAWSPDGAWVAFGKMYMGSSSRILSIWRTPVAGGPAVEMNPAPKAWQDDVEPDWDPAWTPDL
jgi:Tol biopolymer transport system component